MTRGQKGCYIYCEDKNLALYLKNRINICNELSYDIDINDEEHLLKIAEEGAEYIK